LINISLEPAPLGGQRMRASVSLEPAIRAISRPLRGRAEGRRRALSLMARYAALYFGRTTPRQPSARSHDPAFRLERRLVWVCLFVKHQGSVASSEQTSTPRRPANPADRGKMLLPRML